MRGSGVCTALNQVLIKVNNTKTEQRQKDVAPQTKLKGIGRAENVDDLVANHLLDFLASNLEVISGVECCGILGKNAADACGHCKTDVGVDVDLTISHLSCAT